jgi:hypothetical protein
MAKKNTNLRRSAAEERFKKTYGKYPVGPELSKFKAWEAEERFKKTYGKYPVGPELSKFKAWEEAQEKIKNI